MLIRPARESDLDVLMSVFAASVHGIARRSYSAEQCNAWAPALPDRAVWRSRLAATATLLACEGETVAGFIAYHRSGHIDMLFATPAHARRGVATALFRAAREDIGSAGVRTLRTEASLEAHPFFERQGFVVVEEEVVQRLGVALRRFRMECDVSAGPA